MDLCKDKFSAIPYGGLNFIQDYWQKLGHMRGGVVENLNNQLMLEEGQKEGGENECTVLTIVPLAAAERDNVEGGLCSYEMHETHDCVTPVQGPEYYENLLLKGVLERDDECVSEWVLHKLVEFGPSSSYPMLVLRLKSLIFSSILSSIVGSR